MHEEMDATEVRWGDETGNDRTLALTGSVAVYGQQSTCMLRLNADSEGGCRFFFSWFLTSSVIFCFTGKSLWKVV